MAARLHHPFTINVTTSRVHPGEFSWSINQRGGAKRLSTVRYSTFDEARIAMKSVLDILIADWRATQ